MKAFSLEKLTSLSSGCMDLLPAGKLPTDPGERADTWISIGRFDAIQTYRLKLDGQNLFEAIQKNSEQIWGRCNADVYAHALVLISTQPTNVDETFWNSPSWFLSVSRIHFCDSVASTETFNPCFKERRTGNSVRLSFFMHYVMFDAGVWC